MQKKRVVIIGGGFGGVYVAKKLKKLAAKELIEVTLVNRTNYFLFTPLLHEVATGGLSPTSIAEPIREIFRKTKIKFRQAEVLEIDFKNKKIKTDTGDLPYDFLVISTGASTKFHGITGAKEHSLTLKNLSDALKIRSKIIDSFEQASFESDPIKRQELLTFSIVGGGATGVELVAEISEFVFDTLLPFYCRTHCDKNDVRIVLISSSKEILPLFPMVLRDWALKILLRKNIEVFRGVRVSELSKGDIILTDQTRIISSNIFWTAGVSPQLPNFIGEVPTESGRIKADKNLRIEGESSVFVLGDSALFLSEKEPLTMSAQVTVQQAKTVANNVKNLIENKGLKSFKYRSQGELVSLGQWMAVGSMFGFKIKGRFAWWIWRTVYLFKFTSWRKRFRIAFEWTINLFYSRDITKIN